MNNSASFLEIYETSEEVVDQVAAVSLPASPCPSAPRPDYESRSSSVSSARPHPAAYAAARMIVGDDLSLLRANPDGSVTILNQSRY